MGLAFAAARLLVARRGGGGGAAADAGCVGCVGSSGEDSLPDLLADALVVARAGALAAPLVDVFVVALAEPVLLGALVVVERGLAVVLGVGSASSSSSSSTRSCLRGEAGAACGKGT